MYRNILVLVLWAICFSGSAAKAAAMDDLRTDVPGKSTPPKLQEAWLRFHESGLCQEVDSVFVFDANRMEIWSRAGSDKSALKFKRLFEPLRDSHRVTLYSMPALNEKQSNGEKDPPPSLWQNYELRFNLGDNVARTLRHLDVEEDYVPDPSLNDTILKQRLQIYAEQMVDRNGKMGRYAVDVFNLMRMASDPGAAPGMRSRAAGIGLAHAKDLEKVIGKMTASLSLAIPGSYRGLLPDRKASVSEIPGGTPLERAWQIDLHTRDIARRIYRFLYPEDYTVGVDELRNSSLLGSLRALQGAVRDFEKTVARTSWR